MKALLPRSPFAMLITPGRLRNETLARDLPEFLSHIERAAAAGVSIIQIREKELSAKNMVELTRTVRSAVAEHSALVLVNGRADVAIAAGADGVHLPGDEVGPREVVKGFSGRLLISAAVHTVADAEQARQSGVDMMIFAPVFDTGTKRGSGLEVLSEVCSAASDVPVIGLGGVDAANADAVLAAGAKGVAAISSFGEQSMLNWVSEKCR